MTGPAHAAVSRYFEMWNTGDTAIAGQVLHPDWVDHAHPGITDLDGVRQAVTAVRTARPEVEFTLREFLGDGELVAAVGSAGPPPDGSSPGDLVWLFRVRDGLLAELWTYRRARPV